MPFATVKSHRIHYVESSELGYENDSSKATIVMVHGLGSSQNFYVPTFPSLAGHRCIALSTYGAAQSKSNGEKLTLEELADDVIGLMDHLKVERAILAGHSMGGPMVLTVAARHPERVLGVVPIGPVNPSSIKPEMFTSRIETVLKDGMEPLANTVPKAATNANSTGVQRAMIRELIIGQDPKSYASHCEVIVNVKDPGFGSIKVPVLLIAGDEDKSAPLKGVQYIHEHLGSEQKELKVLKGVGHWHCIESGDQVGSLIKDFAAKIA
ncbi:unnamed protein product [Zymoseptoria tritici ST99CH_1A5]|uniref:Serine aminopeptidase S33 domain-containing protein n=4 Tax=Zymoseptoria tritici TaxID=1047171 RepID=A0A1X7S6U2_ZYMT9|nr:unnamed protein product [Zymoseptoria tritici ST99CH_3D7]SMR60341.1 unnamed protein product [Zymoseptoria tritici ST99CH_1E4]SMR63454.1 unnamed protein product [Zymoseptoria tritici ST99CH_3D1]SMY28798.1 unnamed protein product [Zymoseptoria tritici ST99CH_1A5]